MEKIHCVDLLKKMGLDAWQINDASHKNTLQCACPLAKWTHENGADVKPSFGIKYGADKSVFSCFACGKSGTLETLVNLYLGYSGNDLSDMVREGLTVFDSLVIMEYSDLPVQYAAKPLDRDLLKPFVPVAESPESLAYLAGRGVSPELAERFNLKYDSIRSRVVFPVEDAGNLYGAVGRYIGESDHAMRYHNYWNAELSHTLGGLSDFDFQKPNLHICEGFFDMMAAADYVPDANSVCTFKAKLSPTQLRLLPPVRGMFVCLYDSDKAGVTGYRAMRADLKNAGYVNLLRPNMPLGKDVSDMTRDEFVALLERCTHEFWTR